LASASNPAKFNSSFSGDILTTCKIICNGNVFGDHLCSKNILKPPEKDVWLYVVEQRIVIVIIHIILIPRAVAITRSPRPVRNHNGTILIFQILVLDRLVE
jgi:hypothetical protein